MGSVKYFASINLCSGCWKWCIADKDIPKTTFLMGYGLYKWAVMPMGLINTPATFMQTISNLFSNILDSSIAVFLDNILVYLWMVKEHFTFPEKVLAHLYHETFYCKLKKCSFLYNSTIFFGFYIMPEGMHISDLKVQSLKKWPVPTIVKKVW